MKTLPAILLATTLLHAPAWAHGDKAHGQTMKKAISGEQHEFGREGDPARVSRTVHISMTDAMRYSPDKLTVKQGETLRLVLTNKGKLMHELVLGSEPKLREHAEVMKKFPDMEHDEPYMAHVPPAKQQEIIWQFNQPGEFLFGCLLPGHFEAGMVGRIRVVAAQP
ncbi:cupredoxin family protein [Chitinimonas sp. BJYL2]|uniref:cupredoxin domain-containing protein n=1 Tax=Chitinimonas sp. BJYL2 TaxID=2976696 RepID=UPI0022B5C53F|nr:cupredoxin family protein [Chitinimonas sp. BJYL2]